MVIASNSKKDFLLPGGLDLKPLTPDWLNNVWPVQLLDSSMRSLLVVGTIFIAAFLVALTLAIIGRGMPRIRGFIFTTFFILVALFIAFTAYTSIKHWNAPNSVSENALAVANDATYTWVQSNGIKTDKQQTLALVCDYYEAKSKFCNLSALAGNPALGQRALKMDIGVNGYMILIDSKNQIPLIEPTATK